MVVVGRVSGAEVKAFLEEITIGNGVISKSFTCFLSYSFGKHWKISS